MSGISLIEPAASGALAPDAPLVLAGIQKRYGNTEVLKGVDLTLRRGELLVVLGGNGCGKSTLLRCAIRITEPDGGTSWLLGQDLGQLGSRELRRARRDVAVIFQQIALVRRLSAFANVCCGALGRVGFLRSLRVSWLPADVRRRAVQGLQRVGLLEKAWQRASTLSGGQAQRVAIARAYCQEAAVVLADEPVSALDPRAADEVLVLLADMAHTDGLAVLAVLHQPELALKYADRIVGMKLGQVVFNKRPSEVSPAEITGLYAGLPEGEEVEAEVAGLAADSVIQGAPRLGLAPRPAGSAVAAPTTPAQLPRREISTRSLLGWTAVAVAFSALIVYSWIDTQGSFTQFFKGMFGSRGLIPWIVPKSLPPTASQFWPAIRAAATTFACAVLATTFASILAIMLLPFGARNLAPARWIYELTRFLVAIVRAIPELIVLVLLSFVFSFSPFAIVVALTFHGIGIKGKLYSEAVEEMDMTPVDALRVAGAGRLQVFFHGVLPGVGNTLVALTLYRLDSDFRSAVTLGVVGGVGIGYLIDNAVNVFDYRAISVYMIVMVIGVMLVERISTILRSASLRRRPTAGLRHLRLGMGTEQPRHVAIAEALRGEIRSGALAPGSRLPSESQLSARFDVSRGTVRHALAALRAEGLIDGGRGRAPVVRRPGLSQSFDQLVSFSVWAQRLGRVSSARTLELARRPASAEAAQQLAIEVGTPVFEYKRLRLLDGEPVMVERTAMIESVGRLLLDCDLDHGSIYEQLGERGVQFSEAHQTIAAMAAAGEDAALLGIPRRSPLLEVRRRALDPDGRALEWARDHYRGDAFEITIHNQHALPRSGVALRTSPPAGLRAAG